MIVVVEMVSPCRPLTYSDPPASASAFAISHHQDWNKITSEWAGKVAKVGPTGYLLPVGHSRVASLP